VVPTAEEVLEALTILGMVPEDVRWAVSNLRRNWGPGMGPGMV
jgi:hypothetical protein